MSSLEFALAVIVVLLMLLAFLCTLVVLFLGGPKMKAVVEAFSVLASKVVSLVFKGMN